MIALGVVARGRPIRLVRITGWTVLAHRRIILVLLIRNMSLLLRRSARLLRLLEDVVLAVLYAVASVLSNLSFSR